MAKLPHQRALDVLVHRCGEWSQVTLRDGKVCQVFDVAWGYDLGEEVAHITTNCSPGPDPDGVDFSVECHAFLADQIVRIVDLDTNAFLFDLEEPG